MRKNYINKECEELNLCNELCNEISSSYLTKGKKCEYINSKCIDLDKTCSEMIFESGISENICENAKTSI